MQQNNQACKGCREKLFDYVTDCTTSKETASVQAHLEHCDSCKKEYQEICEMLSVLHELPEAELPKGFQLSLHQKLVQAADEMQKAKERSFLGWLRRVRAMGGWKVVAPALVCLVLVLGVYSGGVFDQWMQADSVILSGGTQPAVSTTVPEETNAPTEEPAVTQKPRSVATKAPKVTEAPAPAETEAPISTETVEADASDAPHSGGGSSANAEADVHTPAVMSYRMMGDVPASATYRLEVATTVAAYLDACKAATNTDWSAFASELTEQTAILHLSQAQWEKLSLYIQTTDATLTTLVDAEESETVVVEIYGYEG